MFNKCHEDYSGENNARREGGKSSAAGLFLMLRREWWLILWPNNGAATFLMLTGLHIHPQCSGVGARFKATLATHSRAVTQRFPAAATTFKSRVPHVRVRCVWAACDGATVAQRIEKKNAAGKGGKTVQLLEELRYKWQESHRSRISTSYFQTTAPSPSLAVYAPAKPPQPCEKWKMKNMMTSHTAAKRILIGFNCGGDWTQRSCCVRVIRGRLHPEGQR